MAEKIIKTTFLLRRGTAAQWAEHNPILRAGEPGFELDTKKLKIGNGEDAFNDLPYIGVDEINFEIPGLDEAEVGQIAVKGENGLEWKDEVIPMTKAEIEALIREGIVAANKGIEDKEEFKAAFAQTGMIKLGADMELEAGDAIRIPADADVILDLNGKKLSTKAAITPLTIMGGSLTIKNGTIESASKEAVLANGGNLVIEDAVLTSGKQCIAAQNATIQFDSGEINSTEACFALIRNTNLVVNGGKLTAANNGAIMGYGSPGYNGNKIEINGGEISTHVSAESAGKGYIAHGIYMPNADELILNDGIINVENGAGIVCRGGKTTINGGVITTTGTATGKVGDSRQVVSCAPIVYDKNSAYPGMDSLEIIINEGVTLNSEAEIENGIQILTSEETPNIKDNRA